MKRIAILCFYFIVIANGCTSAQKNRREHAILRMAVGMEHFENGQYPQALRELLEAERLDPQNPIVLNNLGLVYLQRARPDLAEKSFERALLLKNNFTDARNNLGRSLIEQKKFSQAEHEIKIVLKDLTYTGSDRAYFNLGYSYFLQERWKQAEESFIQSLQVNRENCVANTFLGRSYFEQKNYSLALSQFNRAVAFCQKILDDEPHYYSALTLFRLQRRQQALDRLEEVVKLYPEGRHNERAMQMIELIKKGVE